MTESSSSPGPTRRAHSLLRGSALAVAVVAGLAFALAACGGGTPNSSTSATTGSGSSSGSNSSGVSNSAQDQDLRYTQCMRSHGVTNFPELGGNNPGGVQKSITQLGIDPNSPTFQAANSACQKYVPRIGNSTQGPSSGANNPQLKFSRCMRAHGVTNYPDPSANSSGGQQNVTQYGVNPNSPTFQAANSACSYLLSGGNGS
jgi:hypothetical protein